MPLDRPLKILYFTQFFKRPLTECTEKVYEGLITGTVPVYLGAPNIEDFLPAEKCIIKVSDFPDPKSLAEYLVALANDRAEYDSYLAWKKKPLKESFLKFMEEQKTPSLRRLCHKIQELKAQEEARPETEAIVGDRQELGVANGSRE